MLGVPDAQGTGELPRAFVVKKPKIYNTAATSYGMGGEGDQNDVSEEGIKSFIAERLARYKYLDGGVQFVKDIPRNASGKVLKPKLRTLAIEAGESIENADIKPNGSLKGSADEILGGTMSGTLTGTLTEITGQLSSSTNGRAKGTLGQEVTGHISAEFRGNYKAASQRNLDEKMNRQAAVLPQETTTAITSGEMSEFTEMIIENAIESMKQNVKDNNSGHLGNGIDSRTHGAAGEKRKRTGMLTRQAKRQSVDMTAR